MQISRCTAYFSSAQQSSAELESVVSLLIAIAFLGIIISVLVAHARFLRRYQQIKKELTKSSENGLAKLDQFRDHHQGVKTLFEAFKDTSFTHQAFLLFFIYPLSHYRALSVNSLQASFGSGYYPYQHIHHATNISRGV